MEQPLGRPQPPKATYHLSSLWSVQLPRWAAILAPQGNPPMASSKVWLDSTTSTDHCPSQLTCSRMLLAMGRV